MTEGVTFIDPAQAWIGPDAQIGRDTIVWPQTHLIGACRIGEGCQLGPNSRLTNVVAGNDCSLDETVAIDVVIENGVTCGPRAYLRPGTHLLDGAHVGTHVEIKKSTIGEGSKVPHLSYIGDTTMGAGVNVGAGSITCNYDGKNKHATTIGDRTFVHRLRHHDGRSREHRRGRGDRSEQLHHPRRAGRRPGRGAFRPAHCRGLYRAASRPSLAPICAHLGTGTN